MSNFRGIPTALLTDLMETSSKHVSSLLRDKMRIANEIAQTRTLMKEIKAEMQRRADVAWSNRLRLGLSPLPPVVSTPSSIAPTPVGEQAWVELESGDKLLKVCGNCAFFEKRNYANPSKGWCNKLACPMLGVDDIEDCPHFDPMPLPSTPPAEIVKALDQLATPEEMEVCDGRR